MRRSSTVKIKFNELNIQEESMMPSEFRNPIFSNYESNTMLIEDIPHKDSRYVAAVHADVSKVN